VRSPVRLHPPHGQPRRQRGGEQRITGRGVDVQAHPLGRDLATAHTVVVSRIEPAGSTDQYRSEMATSASSQFSRVADEARVLRLPRKPTACVAGRSSAPDQRSLVIK